MINKRGFLCQNLQGPQFYCLHICQCIPWPIFLYPPVPCDLLFQSYQLLVPCEPAAVQRQYLKQIFNFQANKMMYIVCTVYTQQYGVHSVHSLHTTICVVYTVYTQQCGVHSVHSLQTTIWCTQCTQFTQFTNNNMVYIVYTV